MALLKVNHLTGLDRDAPTLLAAMAARTTRISIAVRVLNVCLRHPFLLAAQLAVAQATSGGRLDVGLGAGSFHLAREDHEALREAFPSLGDRTKRLEAMCRALPILWRGERLTDETLGLSDAGLGPIEIHPPRLVAGGASAPVMEIAARLCDGWNLSTPDPMTFRTARGHLDDACANVGRAPIAAEAQLWARDLWPDPRSHLRAFQDAGAELLIIVLDEERGPEEVLRLADDLL